jgi:hypothetical protein
MNETERKCRICEVRRGLWDESWIGLANGQLIFASTVLFRGEPFTIALLDDQGKTLKLVALKDVVSVRH